MYSLPSLWTSFYTLSTLKLDKLYSSAIWIDLILDIKLAIKSGITVYEGPYVNLGIDIAVPFSLYSDILIVINLDIGFILIRNRNRPKLIYKLSVELYISNIHVFPLSA